MLSGLSWSPSKGAIEILNLNVVYDNGLTVLREISCNIEAGEKVIQQLDKPLILQISSTNDLKSDNRFVHNYHN